MIKFLNEIKELLLKDIFIINEKYHIGSDKKDNIKVRYCEDDILINVYFEGSNYGVIFYKDNTIKICNDKDIFLREDIGYILTDGSWIKINNINEKIFSIIDIKQLNINNYNFI